MGELSFRKQDVTVGRSDDAALTVLDARLSRQHAHMKRRKGGWSLEVLESVSQEGLVIHNGASVARGATVPLKAGDRLVFGSSPEYTVGIERTILTLGYLEDTAQVLSPPPQRRIRLAAHPIKKLPGNLPFSILGDLTTLAQDTAVDVAVLLDVDTKATIALANELRARRFFLPIALLSEPALTPDDAALEVCGDAYLWARPQDPNLSTKLKSMVREMRGRETSALPFQTAEILYFAPADGRVFAHDWTRQAPRELRLSDLQHHILSVLGEHQMEADGNLGLDVPEVAKRLDERQWARSEHTIANELSARLPKLLRSEGVHPKLYASSGTREKRYGFSTPRSCLRRLNR